MRSALAQKIIDARREGIAQELAAKTDELNAKLAVIEEEIAALQLGVRAWVEIEGTSWLLGFSKEDRAWRLVVQTDGADKVVLAHAPRHVRLEAVRFLDALLDALVAAARDEIVRAEGAVASAQEFVDALREAST